MRHRLEQYYESELHFIRKLGAEFARSRPGIADRLDLSRETGVSEDPHVERLIEAFAFLNSRIRLKLEDEFPELTDALLNILYPHYLAPIPSMAIVQFEADPARGKLTTGYTLPRHTNLYSNKVDGIACRFRTAYPVTLWPIELVDAAYQTAPFGGGVLPPPRSRNADAMLSIELRSIGGMKFAQLDLDRLQVYLSGDDLTTHALYELIFNHTSDVVVRAGGEGSGSEPLVLSQDCLKPVGFGRDEGLLPYGDRSFMGYRLLTEYFTFPRKFMFFDVEGLERVQERRFGDRIELLLFLDRPAPNLEARVNRDTFRLGCTPVVNLFSQRADPIRLSQLKSEYLVTPDIRNPEKLEVYSIDEVRTVNPDTNESLEYKPFFSFRHAAEADKQRAYWHGTRRAAVRSDDPGTEVYISLVDMDFNPTVPPVDVITLQTTCSNRNLPSDLRVGSGSQWQFYVEGQAPLKRIRTVVLPTAPARLPLEHSRWRLISHLSLNHLSITDGPDAAAALKEMLKLYDYANSRTSNEHIEGIVGLTSQRTVAPVGRGAPGFARGVEITVEFDPDRYVGSGFFLLASVLERFFALYASINSFTRTIAKMTQAEGYVKRWPPRAGDQTLL
jgi:type VI secretion system protein ImpG